MDLTDSALRAHAAPDAPCPHYASSPSWYGWQVGAWLARTGRPAPRSVRMSRGSRVRADGALLLVGDAGDVRPA